MTGTYFMSTITVRPLASDAFTDKKNIKKTMRSSLVEMFFSYCYVQMSTSVY